MFSASQSGAAEAAQTHSPMQLVPRQVAASINPLISELRPHNTIEDVAGLIEDLGIASYANDPDTDASCSKRLHHQMATLLAGALRYEAAQVSNC